VKWLLLLAIQLYWAVWPTRWRRGCLFRESCSRHVYRRTQRSGFLEGIRALRQRYRTCRPGYGVVTCYGESWLVLADGSFLGAAEAAPELSLQRRDKAVHHWEAGDAFR
jgi:hypothetical protein